jgi:hypothetical protein
VLSDEVEVREHLPAGWIGGDFCRPIFLDALELGARKLRAFPAGFQTFPLHATGNEGTGRVLQSEIGTATSGASRFPCRVIARTKATVQATSRDGRITFEGHRHVRQGTDARGQRNRNYPIWTPSGVLKNPGNLSFRGAAGDEESRIGRVLRARFLAALGMTLPMSLFQHLARRGHYTPARFRCSRIFNRPDRQSPQWLAQTSWLDVCELAEGSRWGMEQGSADPRRWGRRLSFGRNRGPGGRRSALLALRELRSCPVAFLRSDR